MSPMSQQTILYVTLFYPNNYIDIGISYHHILSPTYKKLLKMFVQLQRQVR